MSSEHETACPNCGHSPLAAEDERCPECYVALRELPRGHLARSRNLGEDRLGLHEDDDDDGGTLVAGNELITSDAEAHPGMSSALLACLAVFLVAVGLRVVPFSGPSNPYLAFALLDGVLAGLIRLYPALVRRLLNMVVPVQVLAVGFFGRAQLLDPALLALALAPVALLLGLTGEPGARRRGLAFSLGLGLLLYSGTVVLGTRSFSSEGVRVEAPQLGCQLRLPPGFAVAAGPEALSPYLSMSGLDPHLATVSFVDPVRGCAGLWGLASAGRYQTSRLAEGFATSLDGAANPPRPVSTELVGLKLPQVTFERLLGAGRGSSVTAFRLPDERTALLAVACPADLVDGVRQALAAGASFSGSEATSANSQ